MIITIIFVSVELMSFLAFYLFEGRYLDFSGNTSFENFVSIQIGLIFLYITAMFTANKMKVDSIIVEINNYSQLIGRLERKTQNTEALAQDVFYDEFRRKINDAHKTVDISNLDIKPPQSYDIRGSTTYKYYKDFFAFVKKNPHIHFRRLERFSIEKEGWIKKIIQTLGDCKNFSFAVMQIGDENRNIPHVSVQIIDGTSVFLVAISRHDAPHGHRDIWISDENSATIWREYYENKLWNRATLIIDKGALLNDHWNKLMPEFRPK